MAPRILVLAGSIRIGAYSTKTANVAARELALQGAEVTRLSLGDYRLPLMDADLEREKGIPENAMRLARHLARHDGLLVASPEYNSSVPPLLKNTIDWISRVHLNEGSVKRPFSALCVGLCSSSPGALGGIRALVHLRAILESVGAEVITRQCVIARAGDAFEDDDSLKEERMQSMMVQMCRSLIEQSYLLSSRNLS